MHWRTQEEQYKTCQKHQKQSTPLQGKACLLTTGCAEDAIGLRALKVITSSSLDFTSGCQTQTPERKQREANIVRNAISQFHKLPPCCKSKNYLQIRWLWWRFFWVMVYDMVWKQLRHLLSSLHRLWIRKFFSLFSSNFRLFWPTDEYIRLWKIVISRSNIVMDSRAIPHLIKFI